MSYRPLALIIFGPLDKVAVHLRSRGPRSRLPRHVLRRARDSPAGLNQAQLCPLVTKHPSRSRTQQVIIWYEINPKSLIGRGGRIRKISQSVKDNAEGYLTVNEALDEFPKLLSKYRANYNWYKDYNHYIDDMDYAELGG